ncbi:Elp1 [Drosophila busckii]|uniref:Elongator complex protein 1 n=1 Tax=Drosophila busckii TaxID=30019 RepID=A0A0M4EDB0_DROBS|nr:putative elongator complex protein 1 [Drosophila busckii]ALC45754.1 Elp1 [Drosophila busckii]
MRNLKLQYCKEQKTGVKNARQLLLQPDLDVVYAISEDKVYAINSVGEGDEVEDVKTVVELPDIVGAEFLQLENVLCVATAAGEVMHINPDTLASSEGTFCDVGIECMAWSPNQEVVAFVTKTKNVVVMTCNYELLGEQPLDEGLANDQQFVNVGWGKKETQFHGTAGKQAAKQSAAFKPPTDVESLPQDICISWRGDGALFAVSYVAVQVGRTFSVYDCEGKLQHTAEKWNGLQPALAWRPSGNWIAMPQQHADNKSTVALFEKNGLHHREFQLPFDLQAEPVQQLHWSADSDILAVQTSTADEQQHIYLYTIGNYHWYLKQLLSFKRSDPLALCHWDNRLGEQHTLHVLLESGKHYTYRWNFAVDCQMHSSSVYVIDGKRLLVTDFSKAVVPPPMSQKVIELENCINHVNIYSFMVFALDSERVLHAIKHNEQKVQLLPDEQMLQSQLQLAQLTKCRGHYFLATQVVAQHTRVLLIEASFNTIRSYSLLSSLRINGTVNALTVDTDHAKFNTCYVHTSNSGQIYELAIDFEAKKLQPTRCFTQLPQPADRIELYLYRELHTSIDDFNEIRPAATIVGFRAQRCLHIRGNDVHFDAEGVTSYCFAGEYLVYTRLNTLHFVHMRDGREVDTRNIERGGKLVAHAGNERLVLQLPRGNLEVISPRVLVLATIKFMINHHVEGKMISYIDLMRKHRINMNIICDHNLSEFLQNSARFVESVKNTQLCLFISELQNEDFALGMYSSNYEPKELQYPPEYSVERKVTIICRLFCQILKPLKGYKESLIMCHVKLGQLEQALLLIWRKYKCSPDEAEQLFKYLLYLVDVNELYDIALGTYDFALVLFVAQKSQKDPKEFLLRLNELKALPTPYRYFKIDEQLKRYEHAVEHLAACGEQHYELAMDFIKQHQLYRKALTCYQQQTEFHQRVCVAYADHLRANAQLEAASIMYERGGQLQQALLSARHTLDCQRVLLLAQRAGEESLEQVANSLVAPLQQQQRHLEAYELVKQFAPSDSEQPLQLLLEGRLFGRAIHEACRLEAQGATDIMANYVQPALLDYVEILENTLQADRRLFVNYKQRLLDIRKRPATANDMDVVGDDIDELDLLSDTSSMRSSRYSGSQSSRGSGKTFRSSKNRRKHERKLLSLKPGNPFEDIALIDALHNHVTKLMQPSQQQLVRDTCKALLQLHTEDERASQLQRLYQSIVTQLQDALDEIWIPELMGGTAQHLTGPNIDFLALRKEQRYALITPLKRFKPQLNIVDWQFEMLQ